MITELKTLIHKKKRQLKLATLECLIALTVRYPEKIKILGPSILAEVNLVPFEEDLQLAQYALELSRDLTVLIPTANETSDLLNKITKLSGSSIIQGQALSQLLEYFGAIAKLIKDSSKKVHASLNAKKIVEALFEKNVKQVEDLRNASKCIAAFLLQSDSKVLFEYIDNLIKIMSVGFPC